MSNIDINIGVINESSVSSQTQVGKILFTDQGNQYIIKSDGSKMKISDIITVSSLPTIGQANKIYILSTNFSLNYYDSSWHVLSGGNQIIVGTTAPTDTTKLFLDITDKTKPVLKWYNSTTTSWINISSTVDTSTLLDKTTYKGSADGIVKKADTLTGLVSTSTQIDNTVNNSISPNIANRSNGRVVTYNGSTGEEEWADITITGVVGSTQITTISDTTILSGSEQVFVHPSSTNIVVSIEEQIAGSTVTDTHLDFSDSSKYSLQDSGKILVGSNKVQLDIYTKLLMHMDDSTFKDECEHVVTNTGVTLNNSIYKFGTGSAYFNGSSYLTLVNTSTLDLSSSDFNIGFSTDCLISSTTGLGVISKRNANTTAGWTIYIANNKVYFTGKINGIWTDPIISGTILNPSPWNYIELDRKGNILYLFTNGLLSNTITISGSIDNTSTNIVVGTVGGTTEGIYTGYIDEIEIQIGLSRHTSSYLLPITANGTPYLTTNTPTYLKTTGTSNFSLTTIDTITSLTIPVTLPSANTTCKILTSFDNGVNWLYRSSGIWYKYTGDLTTSWTSSNSNVELQTYFTNLSLTTLTTDLSSLGIVPVSFDMAFQLNTQLLSETPSVSAITMVYTNKPHNEFASYGRYSDSYAEFGVKRVSNSQLAIKNLQSTSKTIKVNIVTSV